MLAAAFAAAGAVVERLEAVADDAEAHRHALDRGLQADVIVSSGGVSVGPHDLVRRGRPSSESRRSSGASQSNPGSRSPSVYGTERWCSDFPATRSRHSSPWSCSCVRRWRLSGAPSRPALRAGGADDPLRRNAARDELVRARTSYDGDETIVTPLSGQESHMIVRAATADALVHVPAGEGELAIGTRVRILRLG